MTFQVILIIIRLFDLTSAVCDTTLQEKTYLGDWEPQSAAGHKRQKYFLFF